MFLSWTFQQGSALSFHLPYLKVRVWLVFLLSHSSPLRPWLPLCEFSYLPKMRHSFMGSWEMSLQKLVGSCQRLFIYSSFCFFCFFLGSANWNLFCWLEKQNVPSSFERLWCRLGLWYIDFFGGIGKIVNMAVASDQALLESLKMECGELPEREGFSHQMTPTVISTSVQGNFVPSVAQVRSLGDILNSFFHLPHLIY